MRIINQDILAFSFIIGSLFLLVSPTLLSKNVYWIVVIFIALGSLGAWLYGHMQVWCPCIFFAVGLLWSCYNATDVIQRAGPWVDKNIVAVGIVDQVNVFLSSAKLQDRANLVLPQRIRFTITHIGATRLPKPLSIETSWTVKTAPVLDGQCWRLSLVTRAIHSRLNEGSFDLQRFSASRGYFLRGTVKSAHLMRNTPSLRQKIVTAIAEKLHHYSEAHMMIALLFGERQNMNKEKKDILLYAGIAHLMAISGLHVLLIAALVLRFFKVIQWFLPTYLMSITLPLMLSLIASWAYVILSGMNPPALRAIIGFSGYVFLKFQKVEIGKGSLFLRLVALVIGYDPLLVISDSFWLSCFAGLSLLFLYHWMPCPKFAGVSFVSPLIRLLHLQMGLACLLLPLQIHLFNGVSIGGLWTNLIAVPLMAYAIMPSLMGAIVLFCCGFDVIGHCFVYVANVLLSFIMQFSESAVPFWFITSSDYCAAAFLGWFVIIMVRTRLWQLFSITCLLIVLLLLGPFVIKDRPLWRVDMLDVGHGLAIIIRQGNEAIIYDSGQKYLTSSEAEKQIIPFMQWHNLKPLCLIISHQHNDHIGGMELLKKTYPALRLMSSSHRLSNHLPCIKGKKWQWKQLRFEVLWPTELANHAVNEHSCVIRVSDGNYSVLLTGDLERKQELQLVKDEGILASTVLQVPHHGSGTSSSMAFLMRVNPDLAINSTARYNPWHLPSKKVLNRYKEAGIDVLSTHSHGQITLLFYKNHWHYRTFRKHIKPRWYHDWFGPVTD